MVDKLTPERLNAALDRLRVGLVLDANHDPDARLTLAALDQLRAEYAEMMVRLQRIARRWPMLRVAYGSDVVFRNVDAELTDYGDVPRARDHD